MRFATKRPTDAVWSKPNSFFPLFLENSEQERPFKNFCLGSLSI